MPSSPALYLGLAYIHLGSVLSGLDTVLDFVDSAQNQRPCLPSYSVAEVRQVFRYKMGKNARWKVSYWVKRDVVLKATQVTDI